MSVEQSRADESRFLNRFYYCYFTFLSDDDDCNDQVEGDKGWVASPNYPDKYDNNLNCTYAIKVPEDKYVKLSFDHLDIENGYDYLRVSMIISHTLLCLEKP